MEQTTPDSQTPQRRCANLLAVGVVLHNPVSGSDVVQEQVRKERDGTTVEYGVGASAGLEQGNVAGRALDLPEDSLAAPHLVRNLSARRRPQQAHESFKI